MLAILGHWPPKFMAAEHVLNLGVLNVRLSF